MKESEALLDRAVRSLQDAQAENESLKDQVLRMSSQIETLENDVESYEEKLTELRNMCNKQTDEAFWFIQTKDQTTLLVTELTDNELIHWLFGTMITKESWDSVLRLAFHHLTLKEAEEKFKLT